MQNNEPIWFSEDTYQTINKDNVTEIDLSGEPKYKIMVCTPCHSEVSMHYCQSVLMFQQQCLKNNILVSFTMLKSSLVTQGRNLCVSDFLNHEHNYEYLLFIDSDIDFEYKTIMRMIEADKDIISCPYPLKNYNFDKVWKRMHETDMVKNKEDLLSNGLMFPMKVKDKKNITVEKGIIEVTHAPTGCMLIKRDVVNKMIKNHPELEIFQPTMINGKEVKRENFYNLFDTLHEPDTKRYFGEDFGFCQRWTNMGGKVYALIDEHISHIGEFSYKGRFFDELLSLKHIDDVEKIK